MRQRLGIQGCSQRGYLSYLYAFPLRLALKDTILILFTCL